MQGIPFVAVLVCILAMGINAFTVRQLNFGAHARGFSNKLQMKSETGANFDRLSRGAFAVFAASMMSLSPVQSAYAANYFGGGNYAEVINPKDAVLNDATKGSEEVKAGSEGLKGLINSVQAMRADLAKDPNTELTNRVKSELSAGKIRTVLNKYNSAFEEDTQRGTDRLIRNIIQDMTELDRESLVKVGKTRSDSKVAACDKRLAAAEVSLKELQAFLP